MAGSNFPMTFWLGLMLIFLFGPALHLLPTGGVVEVHNWPAFASPQFWAAAGERPFEAMFDIGRHLILPVITQDEGQGAFHYLSLGAVIGRLDPDARHRHDGQ